MTTAEVARTSAWRVPRGAELIGGPSDGLRVIAIAIRRRYFISPQALAVVLLLSDGSQAEYPSNAEVAWLHPERRTRAA